MEAAMTQWQAAHESLDAVLAKKSGKEAPGVSRRSGAA